MARPLLRLILAPALVLMTACAQMTEPLAPNAQVDSGKGVPRLPLGADSADRMRELFFTVSPEAVNIRPTPAFPRVFGVLMDWPIDGVMATVVALADGTSSVYTSRDVLIMGGYAAATTATEVVALAEQEFAGALVTFSRPHPPPDTVRFFIRTYDDVRVIDEKLSILFARKSEHELLFAGMNRIMTQLFAEAAKYQSSPPSSK